MIAGGIPFVVAERDGVVVGFAKAGPYEDASHYYSHVAGFREVGVHERHGSVDGEWTDVVVVERPLSPAR